MPSARPTVLSCICIVVPAMLAARVQDAAAEITPPRYTLTVIGGFPHSPAFGPVSMPQGLNDFGSVVGYGAIAPSGMSGMSWQNGAMVNLGMPAGYDRSFANRVNSSGQIVGGALSGDGSASSALRWVDGVMSDLGTFGGTQAAALGINDHGRIVGYAGLAGNAAMRAFSWQNGSMSALAVPAWANETMAYDISNAGHIVGLAAGPTTSRPVMWQGGVLTELPVPSGTRAGSATAVNGRGEAVGSYEISSGSASQAAVLWRNGERIELGFLGSTQYALATDINDAGQVVGSAAGSWAGMTGFLWQNGTMHDLRSLLVETFAGYQITAARGINASGQIAAVALIGGRETAVLLTPVPAPASMALLAMAGVMIAQRRRR